MKKLINFFKKLFGYNLVCPKCKAEPCKCEPEIPSEHIRVVEEPVVKEEATQVEFPVEHPISTSEEVVIKTKKKRAPRKKKSEPVKK